MKQEQKVENKVDNEPNGDQDFHQFEPHKFKSKQCAKCFKTQAEHDTQNATLKKGIAAKVIDLKSFNIQNGFEGPEGSGGAATAAATNGISDSPSTSEPNNLSNNLSVDDDAAKGSHLKRQAPLSRQKKEVRKNNLTDNSNVDKSNVQSRSDETSSESGSITDNTCVQLLAFKLKPVNGADKNGADKNGTSSKAARIPINQSSIPTSSKHGSTTEEQASEQNNLSASGSKEQNGSHPPVSQKTTKSQNDLTVKAKEPTTSKVVNKPQKDTVHKSKESASSVKVSNKPQSVPVQKNKESGAVKNKESGAVKSRTQRDSEHGRKSRQQGTAVLPNKKSIHTSNSINATKKYSESRISTDRKTKQGVTSSVTVNLKSNKSSIPVRKSNEQQQHLDSEIQRIAKNLRPVSKTNRTVSYPVKSTASEISEPQSSKSTDSESVNDEERRKIVESKSTFASETLSKTAFTVFSGAHKHDTLPKRLGEPPNRPSVKPLTKEDRNNSDPELFQSVQSEEVQVTSISTTDDQNGEVTTHSQSVTNSQISSEIFFGKAATKMTRSMDHETEPESSSGIRGSVVIVNADGTVNHFSPPSVSSNNVTDVKQTATTKIDSPKEKSPHGFTMPYRVVDLESRSCKPYKVVDIVSNPPESYPEQGSQTSPSVPESKPPSSSTHKDSPTKFPKPSFAFPGGTNSSSINQPPFPLLLHDEKVNTSQEKGYEKPSKVAIIIGGGSFDNLTKANRPQEDDDDLDAAIAVVTGYDNLDQVKSDEVTPQTQSASPKAGNSRDTDRHQIASTTEKVEVKTEHGPVGGIEIKQNQNKKINDELMNQIHSVRRSKKSSKEDTLTMGYERPISILSSSSSGYETMRQKSVSDPDMSVKQSSSDYDLLQEANTSPRSASEHSLDQVINDDEDLPPSPRRRTSSMPSSERAKFNKGHRRERSKTVEVVPTVTQQAKEEIKLRPKRVAPPPPASSHHSSQPPTQSPPPPPPPASSHHSSQPPTQSPPPPPLPAKDSRQRALSPTRIPELQRKQRALSPGRRDTRTKSPSRRDTRTKSPSRHPEAVTDSMPRYPPPPPPHNVYKKSTPSPAGKTSGLRATSPTRAMSPPRPMSPPITIPKHNEEPPFITSTPPKDERIKPTPIKLTDPMLSSSPPRKDDRPKLKFNIRKFLGKKKEPDPPPSPERPVNKAAVHRWLNQQPYLSDEELIAVEAVDVIPREQHSEISFSIDDDLTSAGGLVRASPHRVEQDHKKRKAPKKPPPPPVRPDEAISPATDHFSSDSSRHSPALQKAYSLSPPSIRRLQEHHDTSDGSHGYANTGAARAEAVQPKKPKRRGRYRTTGFEEISRRQAPPPPNQGRKDHIYDEIPYDKKRPAPMPPGEKPGKSAPSKPPRKLSFDERPPPVPRNRSDSNERMDEGGDFIDEIDDTQFTFEETDRELHLKSALRHTGESGDRIDGARAPRRPVRIMVPDEEAPPITLEEEDLDDPSYANLYTMLKQAAALAKRQGEKKRWSSSSDEPADSPKPGKRPVPAPRPKTTPGPVKIDRSTSPIMFPGNVKDKLSRFEQGTDTEPTSPVELSPPQQTSPQQPQTSSQQPQTSSQQPQTSPQQPQTQQAENNTPSALPSISSEHDNRVSDLNLNTLRRMTAMWKSKQEEQFVLGEVSWSDLVLTTNDPCCTSSSTVIYPVVHKDNPHKPLAVQICTKPENNKDFLEGTKMSRSLLSHPNILQVASVFTDDFPESVLGIEPRSPKNIRDDEPGCSSPVEVFTESTAVVTNQVPTAQVDNYVKHAKEIHEFLPEKYEHDVCLLLLQLFQGLQHLDLYHIVHGELNMESLFLSESSLPGKGSQLIIGNFASAKVQADYEESATLENKRQEFDVGLMIYEFLHEKSPFVVKTQLITQEYMPSDLPALPQLSQYSNGLNKIAGELLRRNPSERLSIQKAIIALQCVLWGPSVSLLCDVTEESIQKAKLKTWLDLERAKAVNTVAEKHLAALFQDDQGINLEDQLKCQFLSEITEAALLEIYKLLHT